MILFDYLYRDASNFKAYGAVLLSGTIKPDESRSTREMFQDGGLFIAEQLRIPPLYDKLYRWSRGPTSADHCWHEFVDLRDIDERATPPDICVWGDASEFLRSLRSVEVWDEELSPHFKLYAA